MRRALRLSLLTVPCSLFTSCSVTPLTNKIQVGEEAFVVAVGEGSDGMTDLYAAPAGGGAFSRLTFNRPAEAAPRLSAAGTRLVYLRSSPVETADPEPQVVVLDLRTGAERGFRMPRTSGASRAVAWLPGDSAVAVRTDSGLFLLVPARGDPAPRLHGADSARADSALGVPLGAPVAAMVVSCAAVEVAGRSVAPAGGGLCVRTAGDEIAPLDSLGRDPVRWGADSVGYFTRAGFEVRPLAGGRSRRPEWSGAPARLRQLSYAAAPAAAAREAPRPR